MTAIVYVISTRHKPIAVGAACAGYGRIAFPDPHGDVHETVIGLTHCVDGLWSAIGRIIELFTPAQSRNYFIAAGYDAA